MQRLKEDTRLFSIIPNSIESELNYPIFIRVLRLSAMRPSYPLFTYLFYRHSCNRDASIAIVMRVPRVMHHVMRVSFNGDDVGKNDLDRWNKLRVLCHGQFEIPKGQWNPLSVSTTRDAVFSNTAIEPLGSNVNDRRHRH
jgi:hypothetical protein